MFGKLQGRIDYVGAGFIILTAGGIGFKVFLSARVLEKQTVGMENTFWVETVVREDSISLIGFETLDEQELFIKLTSVSGIGVKLALAIIGTFKVGVLASAIAGEDVKTLSSVSGVGKKVAERIIVELKNKMTATGGSNEAHGALDDVLSALESLGYRRTDNVELAQTLIKENPDDSVQTLITKALKKIAGK